MHEHIHYEQIEHLHAKRRSDLNDIYKV